MISSIILLCTMLFAWYIGFWVIQNDRKDRTLQKGLLVLPEPKTKAPQARRGRRIPGQDTAGAADQPATPVADASGADKGEARRLAGSRLRPKRGM